MNFLKFALLSKIIQMHFAFPTLRKRQGHFIIMRSINGVQPMSYKILTVFFAIFGITSGAYVSFIWVVLVNLLGQAYKYLSIS